MRSWESARQPVIGARLDSQDRMDQQFRPEPNHIEFTKSEGSTSIEAVGQDIVGSVYGLKSIDTHCDAGNSK